MSDILDRSDLLYHGTVAGALTRILPASVTGAAVTFASDTDPAFAYATTDPESAWSYAERSWLAHSDVPGFPRVYRVEALGLYEQDPEVDRHGRPRSNFAGDRRSTAGFRVVEELPFPDAWGDQSDWR